MISVGQISKGGLTSTVADGKVIFQKGLEAKATGIVLAHNHPSGNLKPSEADRRLCNKIVRAAKLLDIQVLDNLIISRYGYFSFADEGEL